MIKTILCAALVNFAACGPVFGADTAPATTETDKARLIDCGSDKAVIFPGTESADGAYAIGWTLRPKKKGTPKVSWPLLDPEDVWPFLERYKWDPDDSTTPYSLVDFVIDLRHKKLFELPTEEPYWPNKGHGHLAVAWFPESKGQRYALVQNDARFGTADLWLVSIDSDGDLHQTEIASNLNEFVEKVLTDKRPWLHEGYEISYRTGEGEQGTKGAIFRANEVEIPFEAEIPKTFEVEYPSGTITIRLPDATVTKVSCQTRRDDPFSDDRALAKADRQLNETYSSLLKLLPPSNREALRKEQLMWLKERDNKACDAVRADPGEDDSARNKSLRESTQSRNTEVKKRLSQLPNH